MTKTNLQIMREKNEELLRANINMRDALDLKSERIQELKKQLATAVEALKFASKDFVRVNGVKEETKISKKAKQALAEIGGDR